MLRGACRLNRAVVAGEIEQDGIARGKGLLRVVAEHAAAAGRVVVAGELAIARISAFNRQVFQRNLENGFVEGFGTRQVAHVKGEPVGGVFHVSSCY